MLGGGPGMEEAAAGWFAPGVGGAEGQTGADAAWGSAGERTAKNSSQPGRDDIQTTIRSGLGCYFGLPWSTFWGQLKSFIHLFFCFKWQQERKSVIYIYIKFSKCSNFLKNMQKRTFWMFFSKNF